MITYVKSNEAKLFEIAAEELGESSLTLDQYLSRLSELYAKSPRFVRLPLYEDEHEDEEIFEIDANARTITVPRSFASNGVGVVSDELAETLWFRINRYFDLKDFALAVGADDGNVRDGDLHILIEWEAPDGYKSASWAYAVDKDTDPDYIYFGWALTSDHLTAKAGQIKFAVRILQYNVDGLAYSFATQPASVTIKSTLEFDLLAEDFVIESVADKISNRIMGGHIAFCPVFTQDLPEYVDNLEERVGEEAAAQLSVIAKSPDEENEPYDAMAYVWYKKGKDDTVFSEVTDLASGAYTPALTVTSSGQYYVVVYGMKQIDDNMIYTYDAESDPQVSAEPEPFWYHSSVASSQSTICEIPMPIPLEIKVVPAASLIMPVENNEETIVIELKGKQIIGTDTEVGLPGLRVEKTLNAAEVDLNNNMPTFEPYTPQDGQVTFVKTEGENPEYKLIFNTWVTETTEIPSEEENGDPTIVTTQQNIGQAYYRFTVQNALNGDIAETEEPVICRITEPAIAPNNLTIGAFSINGTALNPGDTPNASLQDKLKVSHDTFTPANSDGIMYEWYRQIGQEVNPGAAEEEFGDKLLASGADLDSYTPTRGGTYYAQIINTFNGTESKTITDTVAFAD